MRPKGSKDKTKRKLKNKLTSETERAIVADYNSGLSLSELDKKYGVAKSSISALLKRRGVKTRLTWTDIKSWERIEDFDSLNKNCCAIYGIYFINKANINDVRLYVGGSTNLKTRLKQHHRDLMQGGHYSGALQELFDDENYTTEFSIIENCEPSDVMAREAFYQSKYNRSCLINSWLAVDLKDIKPWLDKAVKLKFYNSYTINDDGCWEMNSINKSGYAQFRVMLDSDRGTNIGKYFFAHRVAYWEKYGEYPELIRHKCHNKRCRNPDHLESGNYKDNAEDNRGDFPEKFEEKWLEFGADPVKLSEYFSDRWSSTQQWKDTKISFAVYYWEKQLDLRKKYPEILDSNEDRRFSIEYQKKKRNKKKARATT